MQSIEPGRRMFDEGPRIHDDISDSYDAKDPSERLMVRMREAWRERRSRHLGQAVLPEYTETRPFRLEERREVCEPPLTTCGVLSARKLHLVHVSF